VPLVLQFGKDVTPEDYSTVILAPLVKLYASPDRGTRMALLDHLPTYIDKLDKKAVTDKIFPHLVRILPLPHIVPNIQSS
jgi:SCY1-like protein 1